MYIPHHPVFRDGSTTTHLRVVFNAFSVTSNATSLNDHLFAGPKLQTDLPAILLKWRQFKYVYMTDIAKMYRQIWIDPRDVNFQRILWKTAPNTETTTYQLLTVTYGLACAPFLALRVIKQLAKDEGAHFPLAAPILHNNMYVDDILFGNDDISVLRETRDQLVAMLRKGGFELHKWAGNSPVLLEDMDESNHGLACTKSLASDERLKVLGIEWHPALDVFQISVSLINLASENKRSILSFIAKLYDPLGWVTPVTITAKIFMQRLWREKLTWDAALPQALLTQWRRIYANLSALTGLQIPRWTGLGADTDSAELHGFADASNVIYAAAVYLKVVSKSGEVTINLLIGKSRVAPLTSLSVPRLELSAAVLLAQLIQFVRDSLAIDTLPCFCWTDSMIVLAWLKQHPSRWKTFVAHRVADVQARLPNVEWRHVSTEHNSADCASCGLLGNEIRSHSLWWQGPSWLKLPSEKWPSTPINLPAEAPLETKGFSAHCINSTVESISSRWSSWPKLIRITAYMLRFISSCRRVETPDIASKTSALTALECNASRSFWLKTIQSAVFPAEVLALSTGRAIPSKSPILALRPFLDRDGILRVGGRLRNAPLPLALRQPILLASQPLVNLIIEQAHQRALHAGLQLTSTLRHEFWLLRARSLARAVIHRCVICTRERAAIPSQVMRDLPAVRVTAPTRSFQHCGVDYAGPVFVRASAGRGITSRKTYIALFICLATRAIHLELVADYSTASFLNAYSRFCAHRGFPQSMYSDNGTTFVGADRELTAAYYAALRDPNFQNQTATDCVTWNFLPPAATHFGGIWEAGVRSVKHHL